MRSRGLLPGLASGTNRVFRDERAHMAFAYEVADQRLTMLGLPPMYGDRNPFAFMELQDVQELANFFERKVSAYQVAVQGEVAFDHAF